MKEKVGVGLDRNRKPAHGDVVCSREGHGDAVGSARRGKGTRRVW